MKLELCIAKTKIRIDFSFLLIIAAALVLESSSILKVLMYSGLHELGHIVMLLLLGSRPDSLTFSYYGIGMKHSAGLGYFRESVMLLSGLAVNLALAALGIDRDINLALLILNALPIYPLDMGRVVRIILCNVLSVNASERVFSALSITLLLAFSVTAIYLKNLNLMLIAVYVIAYWLNRGYV